MSWEILFAFLLQLLDRCQPVPEGLVFAGDPNDLAAWAYAPDVFLDRYELVTDPRRQRIAIRQGLREQDLRGPRLWANVSFVMSGLQNIPEEKFRAAAVGHLAESEVPSLTASA